MKKILYPFLFLSIVFFIGCEDEKETDPVNPLIGVYNFPKKNIAGVVSEVLILGAIEKDGKVVLLHPSQKVENGLEIA